MSEENKIESKDESVLFCDMMKSNTSTLVKKVESQIPTYAQLYSDVYTEYLHMIDDLFGTCYIAEKEFFEKFDIDPAMMKNFSSYMNSLTHVYSSQIDLSTNFLRNYSEMRITMIKSYDSYMHTMMDVYAKTLSQINSIVEK
jgi:hypothetical protein